MPVPSRIVVTAARGGQRDEVGRGCRRYSSASWSSPVGGGVRRLAGMWVCSGSHSDANPRASASTASSAGPIVWSVAKIASPMRTAATYRTSF